MSRAMAENSVLRSKRLIRIPHLAVITPITTFRLVFTGFRIYQAGTQGHVHYPNPAHPNSPLRTDPDPDPEPEPEPLV